MRFEPYGPFEIPRQESGLVDASGERLSEFWETVDSAREGLSTTVGCYVFSIRAGRGARPWYVGKAERQTFSKECFTPDKINKFNNTVMSMRGTPLLTLLPRLTDTGKNSRNTSNKYNDVRYVEKMLIGIAVRRNANLVNVQSTKMAREVVVPGILNTPPGRNNGMISEFKNMMGV